MWNLVKSVATWNRCAVLATRRQLLGRNNLCALVTTHTSGTRSLASTGGQATSILQDDSDLPWLVGSAFLLMATSASTPTAFCDAPQAAATAEEQEEEEQEPEIPMYDNVPEEDDETDCFLCRTHRQGPCRIQWRNFEHCAKDHPDDEGAERCAIYVQSFQDCWMKHLNLYLLIAMTLNQERIEEIQQTFTKPKQRTNDLETHIMWQEWENLLDQEGFFDSCRQVKAVFDQYDKSTPIWKVYESLNESPFVVNVVCHVPTRREDGRILRVIYGLDQENRAIGLADYDQQHVIEKAESEGREPDLEYHRVVLTLVPGLTEAVKVKAVYAMDPQDEDDQEDEEEEGVAAEDLDYADDRGRETAKSDILAESGWITLPGLERSPDTTVA